MVILKLDLDQISLLHLFSFKKKKDFYLIVFANASNTVTIALTVLFKNIYILP